MNKNTNINDNIDYVATDCDGGIVSITPRLFIESLCMAASCNETELWKRLNNEPLKSKYDVMSLVTEERLPSEIEFTRIARALKVRKLEVVKCFEIIVKTLPNDTNKLNFQFTWPKNWGENVKEIGEAICEIFRSRDFKNNSLFCNYTTIHNTVTIAADSGKFESAQSFGKLIEALRTVINYVYINSPFETSVNELDEPIYKLVDDAVYSTLHEVALNGVEEGVDLAPLQKYLYQKGVVDLPNVKGDRVMEKEDEYITFKFKVHKDTFEKFKNTNGKTEVTVDSTSYSDYGYNRVVARIRDILRDDYKKRHGNDAFPESLMTPIWEMMYEEKERAAFWQLYNLVKDEHTDYNGKLYKNLEDYVIRKGLALYKPTDFNLEKIKKDNTNIAAKRVRFGEYIAVHYARKLANNIKKENINTTIKAIAKMVADYIGFDVKDVVFTLFHDGDMLTSTGDSDRLNTIARHSEAWYEEVTKKQNVAAAETAKSSTPQQNTSRPTVVIKATNVGASVISSIAEAYNGNVDIRVETEQVGKITIEQQ